MREYKFFKNHDLVPDLANGNYTFMNEAGFRFDLKHNIVEGGIYKQE